VKLFPASLLGRNTLLLVVLILLGQLFAGLLFRQFVQLPFVERLALILANDLVAVEAGLISLPPAQREQFIEAYNAQGRRQLTQSRAGADLILPAEKLLMRRTSDKLVEQGINVIWRREGDQAYFAQLNVEGTSYWVSTSGLQRGKRFPNAAALSWLTGILLAFAGAFLIQRFVNKPLNQLAAAAEKVALNEGSEALPENGPREIAKVCRSFNIMRAELEEQERQRALMLAGISHDLRTPLTKIRLATEMLGSENDAECQQSIVRSCQQLETIIGQFVNFAGVGNVEPQARVSLASLVGEVLEESELPFATTGMDPLLTVRLRPQAFKRALCNILENAHRYGAAPFEIEMQCDNDRVRLRVNDRGPGIDSARVQELLKPFVRGNAARSGPPGAGLGLAIASRIIALENGKLTLRNRDGGGLEVCITLPLTDTDNRLQ
jgi:two-component system, OmpR family, osmolarity sensor histidine kinase EnvZ